jgi:hypothetical protein
MKYLAPLSALVMACGLLALQVTGGLEYTEGGSLYTRASMIAAMIAVATLPLVIDAAWARKSRGAAVVMAVALLAFLGYSLPATTGRTGEIKETSAALESKAIEDKARIQADYDATKKLVDESNAWQPKACAGGNGKNCKSATFVLNQRQASLEKLARQLEAFKAPPPGDLGSELWAGVVGLAPATVRKASVLLYALGLEAALFGLMWFFARSLRAITETTPSEQIDEEIKELKKVISNDTDPLPPTKAIVPKVAGAEVIPWAVAFERQHGRRPRLDEAEQAFIDVARTTIYRRLREAC